MKFHLAQTNSNLFTGYGSGYVEINKQRYTQSLVVLPDQISDWPGGSFETLTAEDFASLITYHPEIVLIGTGDTQRFPHPRLTAPLTQVQIGLEVMNTQAACRTFNILSSEGRRSVALILL